MIITKTPFRMSFFGGGTDMEDYFRKNGGAVLSTTFDKYCYVTVRHLPRFFDYSTELSYSKTERVTSIEDIQHPAIRNAMKMLDIGVLQFNGQSAFGFLFLLFLFGLFFLLLPRIQKLNDFLLHLPGRIVAGKVFAQDFIFDGHGVQFTLLFLLHNLRSLFSGELTLLCHLFELLCL